MLRFIVLALPLLILLLALFGFTVEVLDLEPRNGAVVKLAMLEPPMVPEPLVLGAWLVEACGLVALFLMTQGRCGRWWLDGLVAGWLAWIFRGPLLVITIVVAVRQPQEPWWTLAFGWWVLYSVCGLSLAWLAKHTDLDAETDDERTDGAETDDESRDVAKAAPAEKNHALGESSIVQLETEAQEAEPGELPTEPIANNRSQPELVDPQDLQNPDLEDPSLKDQALEGQDPVKPSTTKPNSLDSFSGET